jgi:hypothetical protein
MLRKAAKLKSTRVLSWCFAVMDAMVLFLFAVMDLTDAERGRLWELARRPGLVFAFALQQAFWVRVRGLSMPALRRSPNMRSSQATGCISRFQELEEQEGHLAEHRAAVFASYMAYYQWLKSCQNVHPWATYDDILGLLHGRQTRALPIASELINLVKESSRAFHQLAERCERERDFSPDFLFY